MPNPFQSHIAKTLQQRREQHLYRSRRVVTAAHGRTVNIDKQSLLSFCSNDYLGLAQHPDIRDALKKGADEFGVGSAAASLISGHSSAHQLLEEEIADFVQRPRALLFSTGYMANLGTIQALVNKSDAVFEDRLNHASLIDAGLSTNANFHRYPHVDIDSLNSMMAKSDAKKKLVVSDSVFSMEGDIAPIDQIVDCAAENNAWLMVDDAHGIGVLGEQGRGTVNQYRLTTQDVPILMATFGKAFGTFGAFVAGDEDVIEYLIQEARTYIYTTACPPSLAQATRTSLTLVQRDDWRREKLNTLINQFRKGAKQLGLSLSNSSTPIQPVMICDNEKTMQASAYLYDQRILISAIRPPTVPPNSARLRITICAHHEETDIELLLSHLERFS